MKRPALMVGLAAVGVGLAACYALPWKPAGPFRLVFRTQPSAAISGQVITPAVTIAVTDSNGAVVSDGSTEIALFLENALNPGGLQGTTKLNPRSGLAVFNDVVVGPAGTFRLRATGNGNQATSDEFTVSPGPAAQFQAVNGPLDVAAGTWFGFGVRATDAFGNALAEMPAGLSMVLGSNPGNAILSVKPDVPQPGAAMYQFSIDQPGYGYTLVASAPGVATFTSNAFTVWPTVWKPTALMSPQLEENNVGPVAIDPANDSIVYAATVGASGAFFYKSTDAGNTWTRPVAGPDPQICALAFDPSNPSMLYGAAGASGMSAGGLLRSLDGGENWTSTGASLPSNPCVLAVAPTHPPTIWMGDKAGPGQLYRSVDGGATFTATTAGPITAVAFEAGDPRTVYVATTTRGVMKTTDSGVTWAEANTGLSSQSVLTLVADPVNPGALYLTQEAWGTTPGIYRTVDGGQHWSAAVQGIDAEVLSALAVDPGQPAIVYASGRWKWTWGNFPGGVARSVNGGVNWSARGPPDVWSPLSTSLTIDPLHPLTIYAATSQGLWKTTTGGE